MDSSRELFDAPPDRSYYALLALGFSKIWLSTAGSVKCGVVLKSKEEPPVGKKMEHSVQNYFRPTVQDMFRPHGLFQAWAPSRLPLRGGEGGSTFTIAILVFHP